MIFQQKSTFDDDGRSDDDSCALNLQPDLNLKTKTLDPTPSTRKQTMDRRSQALSCRPKECWGFQSPVQHRLLRKPRNSKIFQELNTLNPKPKPSTLNPKP